MTLIKYYILVELKFIPYITSVVIDFEIFFSSFFVVTNYDNMLVRILNIIYPQKNHNHMA